MKTISGIEKMFITHLIKKNPTQSVMLFFIAPLPIIAIGCIIYLIPYSGNPGILYLLLLQIMPVPILLGNLIRLRINTYLFSNFSGIYLSFKLKHLFWHYYEMNLTYEKLLLIEQKIEEMNYDIIVDKSLSFNGIHRIIHLYNNIKYYNIPNVGILVKNPKEFLNLRLSL